MEKISHRKRVHLGVLFGTLTGFCQYRIWDGIVEYAKQHDISLTAYFGAYFTSDFDFIPHYETCMECIRNDSSLDGLIILTSSVTTDMKQEDFTQYIERLPKHLAIVSIASPIPDIPSVAVDSINGMDMVVSHLIRTHGKKDIAFIKGPENTWEASQRFEGYKKALGDAGISFNENYVLPGNYQKNSGALAVKELLDKRGLKVDAIVASNDSMASGALNELRYRNIQVPVDIAVAGFDDDMLSWRMTPSITTVRQDFFKLGMVGAKTAHDILNDKPAQEITLLPTLLMTRQSCGCYENIKIFEDTVPDEVTAGTDSLRLLALSIAEPHFQDIKSVRKIVYLITDLAEIMRGTPPSNEKLQYSFNKILSEFKQHPAEENIWSELLHTLLLGVIHYYDRQLCSQSSQTCMMAAISLIQDILRKEKQTRDYEESEFRMVINRVTNLLVSSFDIDSLADVLCKSLPQLFIDTALVCLYGERIENNAPGADRSIAAVLGYDAEKPIITRRDDSESALPFSYTSIEGFDFERQQRIMLLYPLFFADEELGVALLSYDSRMAMDVYAGLRIDISTAVKGASLISKIHMLSITDELTGLLNRRGFFRHASSNIKYMSRIGSDKIPVVMFFDLDRLKIINDTYGHKEGDTALVAFSKILKSTLRETDVVARLGGDEFVVFSTVDSPEGINQLEKRIRDSLEEYNSIKKHPYTLSSCIGSAVLDTLTTQCLEDAISNADCLLYEEKKKKMVLKECQ